MPVKTDAEAGRLWLEGEPLSETLAAFVMIHPNPLAPDRYIVVCSGDPAAVGTLAAKALTPPSLSPEPLEDLVVLRRDGTLLPWAVDQRAGQSSSSHSMGARPTPRGPTFDSTWQLTPQARRWLLSEPAGAGRPGG